MTAAAIHPSDAVAAPRARALARSTRWRGLLIFGWLAAIAGATWFGQPPSMLTADPELARLLRGMAVIKGAIAVAAIAVLFWRFGWPMQRRLVAVYMIGAWLVVGAAVLIWQLTLIPAAALAFHAGELMLLAAAWRDHHDVPTPTTA